MSVQTPVLKWLFSITSPTREAEWEALYLAELPRIYNFFRYRVGEGATAEDLTSLTFEKAWCRRHQYRRDLAAFSTWLFAIARNVAIDYLRRRRFNHPLSLEDAQALAGPANLEEEAIRQSYYRRLSTLLAQLPDRERELLALKYGSGLTNREMARVTGLTESNIGTIVHRTVRSLRARWEEREKAYGRPVSS